MGAAWMVENEHTIIFTPEFNTSSYEFQNGALDPRKMGFKINNHDRVFEFIESLQESFPISKKAILVGQKIREFIEKVNSFQVLHAGLPISTAMEVRSDLNKVTQNTPNHDVKKLSKKTISEFPQKEIENSIGNLPQVIKFFNDLQNNKLKDEEIVLLDYAIDTARFKLGTGWRSANEIENIQTWEDIHDLNSLVSIGYEDATLRFELKKLTEVTELTSAGNQREVMFIDDFQEVLLELPEVINLKIKEVLTRNCKVIAASTWDNEDDMPF